VQATVLQSTPPHPPEPDEVRLEPAGSRTESGVMKPSSKPGSVKVRVSQSKRYAEIPPSVLMR
jgi:hypothetical protein